MKKFLTLVLAATCLAGCETYISLSGSNVVAKAAKWEGTYYKRGVSAQCAAWVGTVMKSAGYTPPKGYALCTNWLSWGTKVSRANMQPGDIVIYAKSGGYHHISIYRGGGKAIHRPTRSSTVKTINVDYRRIIGIRRPPVLRSRA